MEKIETTTSDEEIDLTGSEWLGTTATAKRLGITTRTLYRFIDEGQLPAYRLGRVIRIKNTDIDTFIEGCLIEPGTIAHLYPPAATADNS